MDSDNVLRSDLDFAVFRLLGGVAGFVYLALLLGGSTAPYVNSAPAFWLVLFAAVILGTTRVRHVSTLGT